MNFHNLKFRLSRAFPFSNDLGLRMWAESKTGIASPEPIQMKFREEKDLGEIIDRGPDIVLSTESAQQLMDELWLVGLRPSEGHGSAGMLAATQKHLEDMRAIVAKAISTELPK